MEQLKELAELVSKHLPDYLITWLTIVFGLILLIRYFTKDADDDFDPKKLQIISTRLLKVKDKGINTDWVPDFSLKDFLNLLAG